MRELRYRRVTYMNLLYKQVSYLLMFDCGPLFLLESSLGGGAGKGGARSGTIES
jgi:hypothetical protein